MFDVSASIRVIWSSWHIYGGCGFVLYLYLVSSLRLRRAQTTPSKYGMTSQDSLANMTTDDAQSILKDLVEMEFPKIMGLSIIFALFKTYGIPSVSSLLVATGQLANPESASKRTADTGVLLLEFALNKPSSERTIKAISRMNYLHARYQKSGQIRNSDMPYTLSLFALEPVRWVQVYEWRDLTDVELCACGTFWKAMGDAMMISFEDLPSSKTGWTDGLHWLEEVRTWSGMYEAQNMIPAITNQKLAESHLDVLFLNAPKWLNEFGKRVVSTLVGERLRQAMMYVRKSQIRQATLTLFSRLPKPSRALHLSIYCVFGIRKLILRYLALPRPEILRKSYIPSAPDITTGRYNSVEYLSYPWYVKPTFKRRWGPRALVTRLLGHRLPGDDGNKYVPEGYLFEEIGPTALRGKGLKEMELTDAKLKDARRSGCPFTLR
jgi:hypothetical protein